MSKVQEGMILLDRLERARAVNGFTQGGLNKVREYEDAKMALGRYLKALSADRRRIPTGR